MRGAAIKMVNEFKNTPKVIVEDASAKTLYYEGDWAEYWEYLESCNSVGKKK